MRTILSLLNCVGRHTISAAFGIIMFTFSVSGQSPSPDPGGKTFTIVIDAGHGGKDPGAVGKTSREKDIALSIAKKTGTYISSLMSDVNVIYTRTKDVFIPVHERATFANRNKADLFLSIHVNGNDRSSVSGAETYVMGPSKSEGNLELAKKENSVILLEDDNEANYEGFNPNDPASYIMFSVSQYAYLNQSLLMASEVQDQLRIRAKRKDGGVRQGPFLVLWKTTMPSVLIETGYISNAEEEKYLKTDYGQDVIASAIYRAFRNYKEDYEDKNAALASESKLTDNKENTDKQVSIAELAGNSGKNEAEAETNKEASNIQPPETEEVARTESSDGLVFRVQVMASQKRIPKGSKHFKGVSNLEELQMEGYYKYMTPPVETYPQSQKLKRELEDKFPGIFVVAFLNGKKIPLPEAIRLDKEK